MGVFQSRPCTIHWERAIRDGANPKIVAYVNEAYMAGQSREQVMKDIQKMGANAGDIGWLNSAYRILHTNPEVLRKHRDYIFHVHAKFYHMRPDDTDDCLDYENVVRVLQDIGYDGYLSSEYEGNRTIEDAQTVDSVAQVASQHRMFQRLLAQGNTAGAKGSTKTGARGVAKAGAKESAKAGAKDGAKASVKASPKKASPKQNRK